MMMQSLCCGYGTGKTGMAWIETKKSLHRFRSCGRLLGMTKLTETPFGPPLPQKYYTKCCRCAHEWIARVWNPVYCPGCRTKWWHGPRENRQGLRPGTHLETRTAAYHRYTPQEQRMKDSDAYSAAQRLKQGLRPAS